MLDECIAEALEIFSIKALKSEQRAILTNIVHKRNTMAILPTGFGKSLPYHMYLPVIKRLANKKDLGFHVDETEKILVCSPLIAIMEDQVRRLNDKGIQACFKGMSSYFHMVCILVRPYLSTCLSAQSRTR